MSYQNYQLIADSKMIGQLIQYQHQPLFTAGKRGKAAFAKFSQLDVAFPTPLYEETRAQCRRCQCCVAILSRNRASDLLLP